MDNNATFRRLKFTGLLLRSQWVIKLCSKGGIQMKKTLKKKEHKGRNNVSVYANGPCSCTCFSTCGSAYVQKAQAQNQLYTSVFGSNANHKNVRKMKAATVLISGSPHFN